MLVVVVGSEMSRHWIFVRFCTLILTTVVAFTERNLRDIGLPFWLLPAPGNTPWVFKCPHP